MPFDEKVCQSKNRWVSAEKVIEAWKRWKDQKIVTNGVSPLFSGIVCAYHPTTLGSNPMHTINAFSFPGKFVLYLPLYCQYNKNKQNRPGLAHIFKNSYEIYDFKLYF